MLLYPYLPPPLFVACTTEKYFILTPKHCNSSLSFTYILYISYYISYSLSCFNLFLFCVFGNASKHFDTCQLFSWIFLINRDVFFIL